MSDGTPLDFDVSQLDFAKGDGKVIVVAQDAVTGAVLMVAHADREAVERTVETREMHYTSRTRGLWHKGATSGNVQRVLSLSVDCDRDALLARVVPAGPACHTGDTSCFAAEPDSDAFTALSKVIASRAAAPAATPSYTQRLLGDRNLRLKKLGEEAVELTVACVDGDVERVREECADLLYHMLVAARSAGVDLNDIRAELFRRASS
jgi:phosphoribosyl-AMP cyclohydrolase / phosphoribosyl-ATP pyrophosphohydrolase